MTTSGGLLGWLSAFLARLGVCGNAGVAVGVMTGFVITVLDLTEEALALTALEALQLWLLLWLFGWLALLLIFTLFVRWSARSVAGPALVNSMLVTGLTVLVVWLTGLYWLAVVIGFLIGLLIGFLLCQLYSLVVRE
jgi:hypothetical protein